MIEQPWEPDFAGREIHRIAKNEEFGLYWTRHAKERLQERGLIFSDILFVLKNGSVIEEPEASTRDGYYKYRVRSRAPNSDGREVGVVCVPCAKSNTIKLISVMLMDEKSSFFGGTNKLLEPMKNEREKMK